MATLAAISRITPDVGLGMRVLLSALTAAVSFLLYRGFFSPLAAVPGPLICRFTSLWMWYHTYIGDECTIIDGLHRKYGPVVRVGPKDCAIADGTALSAIYSERGGFAKANCYSNFDLEGHATVFSARDPTYRAKRSKAVLPLFSMNSIRAEQDVIEDCVRRFIDRMKREAATGEAVNMLTLSRRLALEAVCSYVFRTPYGSIEEQGKELSASGFVDTAVGIGRFFFIPNWLFLAFELTRQRFFPSPDEVEGNAKVDLFARDLSREARDGSYQARLKKAGISDHEIEVQCKDLMFAGTDSGGTILASICWRLCRDAEVYQKLKAEVAEADAQDPSGSYNPQSLEYLDAVIREGLRTSLAQPTRFPRVVPAGGWTFSASNGKHYSFPGGTVVGCQPLTLHMNPNVFPQPRTFRPERWLKDRCTPEMQRDLIPFNIGSRQCIARTLASYELCLAMRAIARHQALDGAKAVGDKIEVVEWFNSRIASNRIDLVWS